MWEVWKDQMSRFTRHDKNPPNPPLKKEGITKTMDYPACAGLQRRTLNLELFSAENLPPFAFGQEAAADTNVRALAIAGFNVNINRRFGKLSPDIVFQYSGDIVWIIDRHLRVNLNVKFYKTDMSGLAREQTMKTVNRRVAADVFTENMAIIAASKSTAELIASDMIKTEPMRTPTITLNKTRKELETTDNNATLSLRVCISATSFPLIFLLINIA